MSEKDNTDGSGEGTDSFNRRSFVKALGVAGGTTVFGAVGTGSVGAMNADRVSAEDREATQEEVEYALRAENTQTLLNEIGNPAVAGDGVRIEVSLGDETLIETVRLSTSTGEVVYTETHSGTKEATFFIGGTLFTESGASSNVERQLPAKYRSLPADTDARVVVGESGEPVLIRLSTPSEQAELSKITDVPVKDMTAAIRSDEERFVVLDTSTNERAPSYSVNVGRKEGVLGEFNQGDFENAVLEAPEIRPQVSDCYQYCRDCALAVVGLTGACGGVCRFATRFGWPGIAACVTCGIAAGGLTGYACTMCASNCV